VAHTAPADFSAFATLTELPQLPCTVLDDDERKVAGNGPARSGRRVDDQIPDALIFEASSAEPGPQRRPKVLIVDDNEVCRAGVRESLEQDGFDVVELGSAIGMSSLVSLEKPDVVLMDVEMPAIEGDKAVEILLKHRLHACTILLYSARPPEELKRMARACGADGFVSKAVRDDALAAAIRAHLPAPT